MKFIELIKVLKNKQALNKYLNENYPEIDYYDAEVYLENKIDIDSDFKIFDFNKIDGKIEMIQENKKYINLFTLDLLVDIFEDFKKKYSSIHDVAKRIIEYRINDA